MISSSGLGKTILDKPKHNMPNCLKFNISLLDVNDFRDQLLRNITWKLNRAVFANK